MANLPMAARYALLPLFVAFYYLPFFIPLYSVPADAPFRVGIVPGMEWLQGMSAHAYHYMSIGIMPFIMGGILMGLMQWQTPALFARFAGDAKRQRLTQRCLVYVVSAGMAGGMVHTMPDSAHLYHPSVTFAELMLSVVMLEQLISSMSQLRVASSPVSILLGLNIVSAISYAVYEVLVVGVSLQESGWLIGSVLFALLSAVAIWWIHQRWQHRHVWTAPGATDGVVHRAHVPVKIMRAGVTPLIYASFLVFPLMLWVSQSSSPVATLIASPGWLLLLAVIVGWFAYKLMMMPIKQSELEASSSAHGLALENSDTIRLMSVFKRWCLQDALRVSLWFVLLMVIQGAWTIVAPASLSGLQHIGGVGMVILVSVVTDMVNVYRKNRQEALYG
jgi:preprotein translocase subunit SecY